MKRQGRFALGIGVILVAIGYFAFVGYQEGKAYYKTIDEVAAMGDDALDKRLRVAGVVQPGSIVRESNHLTFTLTQLADDAPRSMTVAYTGTQPIPDTFKDGARCDRRRASSDRRHLRRRSHPGQVRVEVRSEVRCERTAPEQRPHARRLGVGRFVLNAGFW